MLRWKPFNRYISTGIFEKEGDRSKMENVDLKRFNSTRELPVLFTEYKYKKAKKLLQESHNCGTDRQESVKNVIWRILIVKLHRVETTNIVIDTTPRVEFQLRRYDWVTPGVTRERRQCVSLHHRWIASSNDSQTRIHLKCIGQLQMRADGLQWNTRLLA